jgi:DNA-binding transcriptional LysR family regulator
MQVTLGSPATLIEGVVNGQLDIAISNIYARDRGLQSTALCDEDLVLVGAPYWLTCCNPEIFSELGARVFTDVPVVTGTGEDSLLHWYCSLTFGELPQPRVVVTVDDLRGVVSTLLAGAAVGVVPRYLIAEDLADGRLKELHTPEIAPISTRFLVVRVGALAQPHLAEVHTRLLLQARLW